MLTEARQAEENAATAYSQAVAWGDKQAEHAASAEAQKVAKTLVMAQEHQRRQELIMTALKNELKTVSTRISRKLIGSLPTPSVWQCHSRQSAYKKNGTLPL
jgi:flagellar biosynthesis/type III secretory pathway protein FliH